MINVTNYCHHSMIDVKECIILSIYLMCSGFKCKVSIFLHLSAILFLFDFPLSISLSQMCRSPFINALSFTILTSKLTFLFKSITGLLQIIAIYILEDMAKNFSCHNYDIFEDARRTASRERCGVCHCDAPKRSRKKIGRASCRERVF